jgi:hypothetical protein
MNYTSKHVVHKGKNILALFLGFVLVSVFPNEEIIWTYIIATKATPHKLEGIEVKDLDSSKREENECYIHIAG